MCGGVGSREDNEESIFVSLSEVQVAQLQFGCGLE